MDLIKHVATGARRYPSITVSLLIILFLIGISLYAIICIPLSDAIEMWNAPPHELFHMPRSVPPAWTNLFRREPLPETWHVPMEQFEFTEGRFSEAAGLTAIEITFDYSFTTFPSGMTFFYDVDYGSKRPILTLTWIKPDGSEEEVIREIPNRGSSRYNFDAEEDLLVRPSVDGEPGGKDPAADRTDRATQGEYTLRVEAITFEENEFAIDGEIIVYGSVHGVAGTDYRRRDVATALFWGAPIAIMFGFLASIGTTLLGFTLAAIGAWYGGWVDATLQRITEVNMMIPFLPTIMVVGFFLSTNLWVLLGFIVGFSIFTGRLKTYRAMFLQLKSAEYIEAARAYGASNLRIIFRYMIPHIFPAVLPHLILGIPRFVFLEASLAFLGVADPQLLTWGKMLSEARSALYQGEYQSVLGPALLLLLTGLSFSMLGYTLDRIFNPRLRGI